MSQEAFTSFLSQTLLTVNPSAEYIDTWHLRATAAYLQQIEQGNVKRLIINVPPRSLKSICITVAWTAWLLGHNPSNKIITTSYSSGLSIKHAEDTRVVMAADWYKQIFPETVIAKGRNIKRKFVTTKGGFRLATSIGGTLTGEGANVLIVDDPQTPLQVASPKQRERVKNWYDQTFSTRLDDKKNGAIVVIMQRLHQDDLTGHLLKKGGWDQLTIPAIAEDDQLIEIGNFKYLRKLGEVLCAAREDIAELDRARIDLGSYGFASQYQQCPVPYGGTIIKSVWLKKFKLDEFNLNELSMANHQYKFFQSWDCANKLGPNTDYSVCTTWAVAENGVNLYIINVVRKRLEYHELKAQVAILANAYNPEIILIEDSGNGIALLQELKFSDSALPVLGIKVNKDKATRMMTISTFFELGRVFLPESAPWVAGLELELISFPNGDHDDQADSISQFLGWYRLKYHIAPSIRTM